MGDDVADVVDIFIIVLLLFLHLSINPVYNGIGKRDVGHNDVVASQ